MVNSDCINLDKALKKNIKRYMRRNSYEKEIIIDFIIVY
ncbi:MAG: hypothetical protein Q611_LSC00398G0001, partial [Leuconostoc sp. DORA_2]